MARYIDADLLIEELRELQKLSSPSMSKVANEAIDLGLSLAMRTARKAPTADVVEVKHGYWKDIFGGKYDNHFYECSVCGEKALYRIYQDELGSTQLEQALTLGCPYCLTKMDGEGVTDND